MSRYTVELRRICEEAAGLCSDGGRDGVQGTIVRAAPRVFDFDWPLFDEAYRLPLEIKILRHYYRREICCETVGQWKLYLEDRLNMQMPYFNQLYASELLEFNPLYDTDYTDERTSKGDRNTDTVENTVNGVVGHTGSVEDTKVDTVNHSETSSVSRENQVRTDDLTAWDMYSDTPQGGLNGVRDENYLSEARKNTNTGTQTTVTDGESETETDATGQTVGHTVGSTDTTRDTNNDFTGNVKVLTLDDYLQHVKGKKGSSSYSKMLLEYRDTFLNIDEMVIESLGDLFFQLW